MAVQPYAQQGRVPELLLPLPSKGTDPHKRAPPPALLLQPQLGLALPALEPSTHAESNLAPLSCSVCARLTMVYALTVRMVKRKISKDGIAR